MSSCFWRIKNIYNTKHWKQLGNSETEDQENLVNENVGEVQLRNFIRERQIQKDVIETIIEVSAKELLANEPTLKIRLNLEQ